MIFINPTLNFLTMNNSRHLYSVNTLKYSQDVISSASANPRRVTAGWGLQGHLQRSLGCGLLGEIASSSFINLLRPIKLNYECKIKNIT